MTLLDQMMAKEAEEQKDLPLVHHPLAQALGYGALAGEGVHALMGMANPAGRLGFLHRAAHSPVGKGLGAGLIGGSSLFLGAEAAAALKDLMRKKHQDAVPPVPVQKTASSFLDELSKISAQAVVVESHPTFSKPWFKELAQSGVKGGASAGLGAVVAYEATRMMNKLRESELEQERKNKARTMAHAAKEAKVPVVVKM
jgi:hypothetical protein